MRSIRADAGYENNPLARAILYSTPTLPILMQSLPEDPFRAVKVSKHKALLIHIVYMTRFVVILIHLIA